MIKHNIYIAKQPILNKNNEVFAYELLYKDNTKLDIKNTKSTTTAVLNSILNKFGIRDILGKYKAFIEVNEDFIMDEIINVIPKEYFVFTLTIEKKITKEFKEKLSDLTSKGYKFSFNILNLEEDTLNNLNDIIKYFSFIKIDINISEKEFLIIKKFNLKIIATKVNTDELRLKAEKLGYDYIEGYFFCVPKVIKQEKFNSNTKNIINICNKLMNDCTIDEIVAEFQSNPALSIELLKFINSGKFHFRKKLSSIKQVLTLVGKVKLTQWLMLMIYSNFSEKNEITTLLFEHVKKRCALMEGIAVLTDKNLISQAYFTGVISLMDSLFSVSIKTVLKEMNVEKKIKEALLQKDNDLGKIYNFALAMERFDTQAIEEYAIKNNIPISKISNLSFKVLRN